MQRLRTQLCGLKTMDAATYCITLDDPNSHCKAAFRKKHEAFAIILLLHLPSFVVRIARLQRLMLTNFESATFVL